MVGWGGLGWTVLEGTLKTIHLQSPALGRRCPSLGTPHRQGCFVSPPAPHELPHTGSPICSPRATARLEQRLSKERHFLQSKGRAA